MLVLHYVIIVPFINVFLSLAALTTPALLTRYINNTSVWQASPARLSSLRARTPERLGCGGTGSSLVRANSSCNKTRVTRDTWHMAPSRVKQTKGPGRWQNIDRLPCSCRGKSRKCWRGKLEAGRSCLWTPPGTGMKPTGCKTETKILLIECLSFIHRKIKRLYDVLTSWRIIEESLNLKNLWFNMTGHVKLYWTLLNIKVYK